MYTLIKHFNLYTHIAYHSFTIELKNPTSSIQAAKYFVHNTTLRLNSKMTE